MSYDQTGAEKLSEDACWARLRGAEVARLAVVVEGHPEIFPINYVVDHGALVFRSAEGTKVAAALSEGRVALEVDGVETVAADAGTGVEAGAGAAADPGTESAAAAGQRHYAWSVVVKGEAEQITGTAELMDTVELPLTPWQGGQKGRFLRIRAHEVTGRRFPVASPESWRTSVSGTPHAAEE